VVDDVEVDVEVVVDDVVEVVVSAGRSVFSGCGYVYEVYHSGASYTMVSFGSSGTFTGITSSRNVLSHIQILFQQAGTSPSLGLSR